MYCVNKNYLKLLLQVYTNKIIVAKSLSNRLTTNILLFFFFATISMLEKSSICYNNKFCCGNFYEVTTLRM